jgi:hypothetical protein
VEINGLTITHGRGIGNQGGGGILNVGSSLVVANDTFSYNSAGSGADADWLPGGAISNLHHASLSATDTAFISNQAVAPDGNWGGNGGAIANFESDITLVRCSFTGNLVKGGNGGTTNGSANGSHDLNDAQGGAIVNKVGSHLTVKNCTFTANQAIGGNGAIALAGHSLTTAGIAVGGAIGNHDTSVLTVDGSVFSGNQTVGGSNNVGGTGEVGIAVGGAFFSQGVASVTNSRFDGNKALGGSGNSSSGGPLAYPGAARGGAFDILQLFGGSGQLSASGLTVTNNLAKGGDGNSGDPNAGLGIGGGMTSEFGAAASVSASSFSGNTAMGGAGFQGFGGDVANLTGSATELESSTISNGTAAGGSGSDGGGVFLTAGDDVCATSTIFSGNTPDDSNVPIPSCP